MTEAVTILDLAIWYCRCCSPYMVLARLADAHARRATFMGMVVPLLTVTVGSIAYVPLALYLKQFIHVDPNVDFLMRRSTETFSDLVIGVPVLFAFGVLGFDITPSSGARERLRAFDSVRGGNRSFGCVGSTGRCRSSPISRGGWLLPCCWLSQFFMSCLCTPRTPKLSPPVGRRFWVRDVAPFMPSSLLCVLAARLPKLREHDLFPRRSFFSSMSPAA